MATGGGSYRAGPSVGGDRGWAGRMRAARARSSHRPCTTSGRPSTTKGPRSGRPAAVRRPCSSGESASSHHCGDAPRPEPQPGRHSGRTSGRRLDPRPGVGRSFAIASLGVAGCLPNIGDGRSWAFGPGVRGRGRAGGPGTVSGEGKPAGSRIGRSMPLIRGCVPARPPLIRATGAPGVAHRGLQRGGISCEQASTT